MSDTTRLKSTIYIGGLEAGVTKEILHGAFVPFGEIVDISIPKADVPTTVTNNYSTPATKTSSHPSNQHRGFGYVEFELPQDAREAIDNMDQSELFGRVIKVAQAKPQKEANEGLGSKIAVWEQEGYLAKHAATTGDGNRQNDGSIMEQDEPEDPMQGLDRLDVAGPQVE